MVRKGCWKVPNLKPAMDLHKNQVFLVGSRVRVTMLREHALRDVPDHRLTALGVISKVYLKFAGTPSMSYCIYVVRMDTELLSSVERHIVPGKDRFLLEVTDS